MTADNKAPNTCSRRSRHRRLGVEQRARSGSVHCEAPEGEGSRTTERRPGVADDDVVGMTFSVAEYDSKYVVASAMKNMIASSAA